MRDPQVVRSTRVQKMSLCAIGIPVSGWPSPLARRASARFAASRASDSSKSMKAFSCRLKRPMRSRHWRVSSTEEIFPVASAADSSLSVALSTLLDHLRDQVQAILDRGRDGLTRLALVGFTHLVGPQALPL